MKHRLRSSHRGFTLIEIIVVVVVIGILAAISIVVYTGVQDRAKNTQLLSVFDAYDKALKIYYSNTGTYPESPGDINSCVGGGYTATADFGENECQKRNGLPATTVRSVFDTALASVLGDEKPAVNPATSYSGPNPNDGSPLKVRGLLYNGGQNLPGSYVAVMFYYMRGTHSCGRGTALHANVGGVDYTQCAVKYENGTQVPVTGIL
jgi:prepilin-type N-terminal cleavage/methylation domain-containing protein